MARSRSFTIYLLKKDKKPKDALEKGSGLKDLAGELLPAKSKLFVMDNPLTEPWWREYFGIKNVLKQATKGAILFLPVQDRLFAITFGMAYHKLKSDCIEYDFGLLTALNCIDPQKLKSVDGVQLDNSRRQRTQLPIDSELSFFDFDQDKSMLKSISGKVKKDYQELFKHATTCTNSIKINSNKPAKELPDLCRRLFEIYQKQTYKKSFPNILDIAPIKDPLEVDKLNKKLEEAVQEQNPSVMLAIPDILDYSTASTWKFSGAGKDVHHDDLSVENYFDYLARRNIELTSVSVDMMRKHEVTLYSENEESRNKYSVFKCLVFDTKIRKTTYYCFDGEWFSVKKRLIDKLRNYLDDKYKENQLPEFRYANEAEYNKSVADESKSRLCLDKVMISLEGSSKFEPCDILEIKRGQAIFHHVKRGTSSAMLSHLFNQGYVSIVSLRDGEERLQELISKVKIKAKTEKKESKTFIKAIENPRHHKVVYSIITHKDPRKKSANLPVFAQISLRKDIKQLNLMNVDAHYSFVKDDSSGKK